MLSLFLSLPVVQTRTNEVEAYEMAWRPAGSKPIFAQSELTTQR